MAEDWSINVLKYVPDADPGVIKAIVRYCGIALQKRDSSLVSFSDAKETDRVRENFLKKKLGLSQTDAELDGAIAAVGARMAGENFRNRVTVYYLLAAHFEMLTLFGGITKAAGSGALADPAPTMAPQAFSGQTPLDDGIGGGTNWRPWLLLGLLIAVLFWFFFS